MNDTAAVNRTAAVTGSAILDADHPVRGLIVDWGGVLTRDIGEVSQAWATSEGIDLDVYSGVLRDWLGEPAGLEARFNPIHALERGEIEIGDFESRLAAEMSLRTGRSFRHEGFLDAMFAALESAHDMVGLVRRAHEAGIRTGLLSNSWGNSYPRDGWDEMFDVVVISGEVGMRKPERRIFEHTLTLMDLDGTQCAFVDDLRHNIVAAKDLGIIGVHHRDYDTTAGELEALFGLPLA